MESCGRLEFDRMQRFDYMASLSFARGSADHLLVGALVFGVSGPPSGHAFARRPRIERNERFQACPSLRKVEYGTHVRGVRGGKTLPRSDAFAAWQDGTLVRVERLVVPRSFRCAKKSLDDVPVRQVDEKVRLEREYEVQTQRVCALALHSVQLRHGEEQVTDTSSVVREGIEVLERALVPRLYEELSLSVAVERLQLTL